MDSNIKIFMKIVILYTIVIIIIFQCSSCDHEKKTKKENWDTENCKSLKMELLLRNLLKKSFIFPKFTFVDEDNDTTISYYLRLINFAVPKRNYYLHLAPSDSDKTDSVKLVLTDTIITKGRIVVIDISEKNEDTSKVKISVGFGINNIASGKGLYDFEFIVDSCSWNMKDSAFSWEY